MNTSIPQYYSFYGDDYARNRLIATYMFGGERLLHKYAPHCKGGALVTKWVEEILTQCKIHRNKIAAFQVMEIEEWFSNFKQKEIGS